MFGCLQTFTNFASSNQFNKTTQIIFIQSEYGKYSEKRVRHKDISRDMCITLSGRVAGAEEKDSHETDEDGTDLHQLEERKDLSGNSRREEGSVEHRQQFSRHEHQSRYTIQTFISHDIGIA